MSPIIRFIGDGVRTICDITFPYIDGSHLKVSVNGALVPFLWDGPNRINLISPPPNGAQVAVFRQTPDSPMVDFAQATSGITEQDLNTGHRQGLYRATEAVMLAGEAEQRVADAERNIEQTRADVESTNDRASTAIAAAEEALRVGREVINIINDLALPPVTFASRAAFEKSHIPASIEAWSVMHNGIKCDYVRDLHCTAIASRNGVKGKPAGYAAYPEHWGIDQHKDETSKFRSMWLWTTPNAKPIDYRSGFWMARDFEYAGYDVNVHWFGTPGVKATLFSTAPFESKEFLKFVGSSYGNGYVSETMKAGDTTIKIPKSLMDRITVGRDQIRFQSSRIIEMDNRGQARYGLTAIAKRKIDDTTLELDCSVPIDMLVTPSERGVVTSVDAANSRFTVASFKGRDRTEMRYRVQFVTVNGKASTSAALPDTFNPDTGAFGFVRDFPSGLKVGDTVEVQRNVWMAIAAPVNVSVSHMRFERPIITNAPTGASGNRGFVTGFSTYLKMHDLEFSGFSETSINCNFSHRADFSDIYCEYSNRGFRRGNSSTDFSDGTGYGISVGNSNMPKLRRITGYACRRTIDLGGTQATTWDAETDEIIGIGGGPSYDGLHFWPNGPVSNSVTGSHGDAARSIYRNTRGVHIETVVNLRGQAELVDGIYAAGRTKQMINSFQGGVPHVRNVSYTNSRPGWLPQAAKYAHSKMDGYLGVIWNLSSSSNSDQPVILENVDVRGVDLAGISFNNGGRYSNVVLGGTIYVEHGAYEGTTFDLLRATGHGNPEITHLLDLGKPTLSNDADIPNDTINYYRSSVILRDGAVAKWPDGSKRIHIPNNGVAKIPSFRTGVAEFSLRCQTPSRPHKAAGVHLTARGREYENFGEVYGKVNFLTEALTGTTGEDGAFNVSYLPSGQGNFAFFENRTGKDELWVIHHSDLAI